MHRLFPSGTQSQALHLERRQGDRVALAILEVLHSQLWQGFVPAPHLIGSHSPQERFLSLNLDDLGPWSNAPRPLLCACLCSLADQLRLDPSNQRGV